MMLKKWLGRWLSVALLFSIGAAQAQEKELLIYCGITMVRPITELARQFEQAEKVRVTISQGGSEDLYQSAKRSRLGDIYFPGEPSYRARHLAEGLLGYHKLVGYNQVAIILPKGNPKQVKPDLQELLRKDLVFILGNAESGSIGQEGKRVLDRANLYPKAVAKAAVMMPDSRAINLSLRRGEGDVALNWRATAFFPDNAPHLDVVDLDTRIAEPQALLLIQLSFSKHPLLAQKFIDFAASPEGQAVFRKYGFLDNRTR
ncbi:MAG: substrate-binding domain-containing protein [Azonexus sp.]|nr:substrate-binding domain-containing protein [Azonexus sp.]